ncbi:MULTISPECIES: hypothetical protein [unclassified Microcoleus]|uniref:hypothetical protein n=1 Tax=unclassified Microcoleus TaxID=2642155 RepID=UPI002FCFF2AD
MNTVNILLLKILAEKTYDKNIKEIQGALKSININICERDIYQRLRRMKSQHLIIAGWKGKIRVYAISDAGKFKLATFQEQLRA